MKRKTLSIGGATLDLFCRLPKDIVSRCADSDVFALPLGEKIRVADLIEACGGGASNTAVGLSRLGYDSCFEGVVGSDQWGEKLIENLQSEGVDTSCATIVEGEVTSFSIILSGDTGERVILNDPGTNAHLHDITFDKHKLAEVDWVYLNSVKEDSCEIQDDIVEMLANDDTCLTWNPGGCQIEKGLEPQNNQQLLKHTDLLLLNREEAERFTGEKTPEDALRVFLDCGAKNVVITDGKNGTTASDGKSLLICPVVSDVEIIDTTGAGDAFGTAVTWALLSGKSLPDALKAGSINAASVVGSIGAETALLTDTEIENRLEDIDLAVTTSPLS